MKLLLFALCGAVVLWLLIGFVYLATVFPKVGAILLVTAVGAGLGVNFYLENNDGS